MKRTISKTIKKIREIMADEGFARRHKRGEKDFCRNRKLGFSDVVEFVLGRVGTSFVYEAAHFSPRENISAAAISKARDKVQYSAFAELLRESANEFGKSRKK